MRKYDPLQYNKNLWMQGNETKNHPRNCKGHHRFCSLQYEWTDNNSTLDNMNHPINSEIPNVTLPYQQQKVDVKYENMTEEQLDDWVAQSMNRTIDSILNPNKKFYVPSSLDDQLKVRYRKKRKNIKIQPDDSYFKTKKLSSNDKAYLNHKKNKTIDLSELLYDYKKLQPKSSIGKTPIQRRQFKSNPPKSQPKRRNAILLDKDAFYLRFIKQQRKNDQQVISNVKQEKKIIEQLNKNKLFTFNYESMKRKSSKKLTPTSITEYEGLQIEFPDGKISLNKNNKKQLQKQEQQQEMYRLKGNATAQQAYSMMENLSTRTRRTATFTSKYSMHQPPSKTYHHNKEPSVLSLTNLTAVAASRKQKRAEEYPKHNLGKKVMKLLQDMHIQSQTINPNMAQFELHPDFIEYHNLDPQNMAHNWVKKAQEQLKKNNHQTAFQCYKQAIIIQPDFFNAVYNFSTLLEKESRFRLSFEWFKVAKQFSTDNERVGFALALINLKMQKYDQALEEINSLINEIVNQKKKVNVYYLYIRALALKKQGRYQQAKKDYTLVLDQSKPSNYADLSMFVMSYVFAKKRRFFPHLSCKSDLKFRQISFLNLYEKKQRIHNADEKQLVIKIQEFPFFKRFSITLIQKLIKVSSYEYHQKNEVIFVKPDECIILLDGLLAIKNHQKNIKLHEIITVIQRGDFVGANEIDDSRNSNINNWYYSQSDIQILRLKSLQFQSFWKGQITFEVDFKYNQLKNCLLFQNLSDSTLFKLCEQMKLKTYTQNTVFFNDCSYKNKSFSKNGQGFTLIQNNKEVHQKNQQNSFTHKQLNCEQFNQIKYEGLFLLKKGQVQIQDDQGFSNSDIISEGDFFGQNLIVEGDGFHNYGRLVVASEQAEFYVLQLNDLKWFFSFEEKQKMRKNCQIFQKRRSLEAIRDLRKRFYEYLEIRQKLQEGRRN